MTNRWSDRARPAVWAALAALVAVGAGACSGPDDAPTPQVTRTTDDAAANDALYGCLVDRGFAVTRGENGAIEFKDPEDVQGESFTLARTECLRQLEADGTVAATGPESLRAEYAAMSGLHACLVARGVGMDPWPTEAVFVEQEGAFNVLSATEELTMERAAALCPDEAAALGGL